MKQKNHISQLLTKIECLEEKIRGLEGEAEEGRKENEGAQKENNELMNKLQGQASKLQTS